jgi:hypothetical protein
MDERKRVESSISTQTAEFVLISIYPDYIHKTLACFPDCNEIHEIENMMNLESEKKDD